ncbi:MAG: glutamine--fructose-6-phosphate transaminase (isomerizing) [Chlamydiales bacterium]
MCGIFGCISTENVIAKTLAGLKNLEYRGYDSAGIAGIAEGNIIYCKEVGKIAVLEEKSTQRKLESPIAIAHTRWATHGVPSEANAHPHLDEAKTLAVVHNGIIENHQSLRDMLKEKGVAFRSESDTEVIAHLIAHFYTGNILEAVRETLLLLHGSYAIAVIHKDFPDRIIVAAHSSPLAIGIGSNQSFISSDPHAFIKETDKVMYIGNKEIAVIKKDSYEIYDTAMTPITKEVKVLMRRADETDKGAFEHFTLKEIYEQPQALRSALAGRCLEEYGTATFDELNMPTSTLLGIERILILACGTSMHAGMATAYLLEDLARIPTQVEISSEFRYKNPVLAPGTLAIAISQSGETADTLAAVRELKTRGCPVLGVCNVYESSLAREADATLFLRAGPEIGVCSTKAFTCQSLILSLFSLAMARMRHLDKEQGKQFIKALMKIPDQVQRVLNSAGSIEGLAKKYAHYNNFFYLGRYYMYPAALEGALKVKEIAYVNANGYPGGEMKHGPIALIGNDCPTVALCANQATLDKFCSNLMAVKARHGPILGIAPEGTKGLESIVDDLIWVPRTIDELAIIPTSVVLQLLAYYIAKERGTEIDQPRNLAKSVTVE